MVSCFRQALLPVPLEVVIHYDEHLQVSFAFLCKPVTSLDKMEQAFVLSGKELVFIGILQPSIYYAESDKC
jgi:hypothetical protein